MRSNIARTWGSSRVPGARPPRLVMWARLLESALVARAAELTEEGDEVVELLRRGLLQAGERRHRRRRVDERARDRLGRKARGDVGQLGPRPVVAVLPDLVARQAARLADDELARLELALHLTALGDDARRRRHVDLRRRTGRGAEVREVAHRRDLEQRRRHRDRT